jgi:hypothetical protein
MPTGVGRGDRGFGGDLGDYGDYNPRDPGPAGDTGGTGGYYTPPTYGTRSGKGIGTFGGTGVKKGPDRVGGGQTLPGNVTPPRSFPNWIAPKPTKDGPGYRTDAEGKLYWYEPSWTAEQANNPAAKAWAYQMGQFSGSFGNRQAQNAWSEAMPRDYWAPPAPATPPSPAAGAGFVGVLPSPSTSPGGTPTPPTPGGGAAPSAPPMPVQQPYRYFPIGQTQPGMGGATQPLQVQGQPAGSPMGQGQNGGAGQQPGGAMGGINAPYGASRKGFDPAQSPGSDAASRSGAMYQQRQTGSQARGRTKWIEGPGSTPDPYTQRASSASPWQMKPQF